MSLFSSHTKYSKENKKNRKWKGGRERDREEEEYERLKQTNNERRKSLQETAHALCELCMRTSIVHSISPFNTAHSLEIKYSIIWMIVSKVNNEHNAFYAIYSKN